MGRNTICCVISLALVTQFSMIAVTPVAAQNAPTASIVLPTDRTVLPIPEPQYPHSSVMDVRNATPPPRFEVKAPDVQEMKKADRVDEEKGRTVGAHKKVLSN